MTERATLEETLRHACHGWADSEARWMKWRQDGADDEKLMEIIRFEFGSYRGVLTERFHYTTKGERTCPQLFLGSLHQNPKPILQGNALLKKVREVMEIPHPGRAIQKGLF